MKASLILMLLAPMLLVACQSAGLAPALVNQTSTEPNAMPQNPTARSGAYLFKLKPNAPDNADTLAQLYRAFQSQAVQSIKPIGNAWYLLILNKNTGADPGLAFMQSLAKQSGLIETLQPNLPYGINPPKQPAPMLNGL